MAGSQRIVVIGAGIIGASIAWHLARKGCSVTIIAETPGGVATPNSFAWINASWGNSEPYYRLRALSMQEWDRLADDIPSLPLTRRGGLCWDMPAEELDAYVRLHGAWGYAIRAVDASEIAEIEPNLAMVPAHAVFVESEAAVEPESATLLLLDEAVGMGAEIHGAAVTLLREGKGRTIVVETDSGEVEADRIVLGESELGPAGG